MAKVLEGGTDEVIGQVPGHGRFSAIRCVSICLVPADDKERI